MLKTSKKILSTIMVVIMVLTAVPLSGFVGLELPAFDWGIKASALAESGQCGENVYWTYNSTTKEVVISGSGEIYDCSYYSSPFYNSDIESVIVEDGVTSIGVYAFINCYNLINVIIPNSVLSINAYAFYNCYNMSSITLGNGLKSIDYHAFRNCYYLTSINIPNGVVSIGYEAFLDCKRLADITLPDSLVFIGDDAFYNTFYYKNSLNWENDVLYIGKHLIKVNTSLSGDCTIKNGTLIILPYAFQECYNITSITIPDSVVSIGNGAFSNCINLTDIIIPDSVANIGDNAFYNCTRLMNATVGKGVTTIGYGVFNNCQNLAELTIGMKDIPSDAFKNRTSLKKVTLLEGVERINDNAFYGCTYLETINIPNSVTYVGVDILKNTAWFNYKGKGLTVFDGWVFGYKGTESGITINLPADVKGVADGTFTGDSNIVAFEIDKASMYLSSDNGVLFNKDKTVLIAYPCGKADSSYIIPNSVVEINERSFYQCNNLSKITIGDNVEIIGNNAFYNCKNLRNITIGKSVKSIGESAFYYYISVVRNVYITDLEAWCKIDFANESSNPMYNNYFTTSNSYCSNFYINGVEATNIVITDTISEIKPYAFYKCKSIKNVTISDSVTSIGEYAFNLCLNLKDVYYPGSQEDWDAVEKGYDGGYLTNADIFLMHKHNYTISVTTPPTCTTEGEAFYQCSLGDTKTEIIPALGHTWDEGKITSNSTCNYGGTKIYTCTVCFDAKSETIATLDHDYQLSYSVEPTCTKDGYTVYQCTQCPSTDIRTTDAMLGHDWQTEFTVDIDSTCTKTGVKSKHCNRCSETTDETIVETKEHSWQTQQTITKTPTCIAEGEAAILCKDCKVVKTGSIVAIEPLGHNASEQEFTIDVAATCQSTGRMSKHCTRCNYTEQATIIPTADHDYHVASSSTATCYEGGKAIYVCDGCGDWYAVENSDALGHDYDYLIVESPTCKREGIKIGVCIRCGDTDTRSIDKIDHDYVRTEVSPTCLDDGLATYTCSYGCGTTYDEILPALGHSYPANWTILMKSTCTERGLSVKICKACAEIMSQTLPKLAHEDANNDGICDECGFGESSKPDTPSEPEVHKHSYTSTVTKAPTCTESGIVKFACNCGDTFNEYPAALGHSDADGNGLCDVCGYGDAIKPDVPEDPSANCSCNCHKSGLSKILFNIILFFQKLLRSNKTCICEAAHY